MDLENFNGQMVENIMDNGRMVNKKEMEII